MHISDWSSDVCSSDLFGDLLFAVVNFGRHLSIDAETALRLGNDKFTRRFEAMETMACGAFPSLPLEAKEALWEEAQHAENTLSTLRARSEQRRVGQDYSST